MAEIHQPDPDPADPEPLQITTPVIHMQDLEHNAGPATRMSNKGVRVEPRIDSADVRDLARDDEDALHALEEIEQALHGQLPG